MKRLSFHAFVFVMMMILETSTIEANSSRLTLVDLRQKINEISMCLPPVKPASSKDWDTVNAHISDLISHIDDTTLLADLAIWCYFGAPTAENIGQRAFVYVWARDACIFRISSLQTPAAHLAFKKLKRTFLVDGDLGEVIDNASEKLHEKSSRDALFSCLSPVSLELRPLSAGAIKTRVDIVQSFWSSWDKHDACTLTGEEAVLKIDLNNQVAILRSLEISNNCHYSGAVKKRFANCIRAIISEWRPPARTPKFNRVMLTVVLRCENSERVDVLRKTPK